MDLESFLRLSCPFAPCTSPRRHAHIFGCFVCFHLRTHSIFAVPVENLLSKFCPWR